MASTKSVLAGNMWTCFAESMNVLQCSRLQVHEQRHFFSSKRELSKLFRVYEGGGSSNSFSALALVRSRKRRRGGFSPSSSSSSSSSFCVPNPKKRGGGSFSLPFWVA